MPHDRSALTLRFLGAAGTVTGSRFLIHADDSRTLIDCGLFQGLKELRLRNWAAFPVEPGAVNEVVLTHAHLDHSGYIPALARNGFAGRIHATDDTYALCRILLPDSGRLQEEEAEYARTRGYSKHSPPLPLYTEQDAEASLSHFATHLFDNSFETGCGRVTFRRAGHILGAAGVLVELSGKAAGRRIFFSGDLGRPSHPLLKPPAPPPATDVIVVESTYGDRTHDDAGALEIFRDAIARTRARGGVIIIPSFAVDRTEVVLFALARFIRSGELAPIAVYVDSPMALAALELYKDAIARRASEIRPEVAGHPEQLEPGGVVEVRSVAESIALNAKPGPMIIISASGMATGGRVLHHLANRLGDERNTVILVGYQAQGTRGRHLLEGAPTVKMLGRYVAVRAEIVDIPAFSVHADREETLGWLASARSRPELVYVVHGDPPAAGALADAIGTRLGWNAVVPRQLEQVRLD